MTELHEQTGRGEPIRRQLDRLAGGPPDERVSLGELSEQLGARGFGLLIFLFAVPNCLPFAALPGLSAVTGLALVFLTLQLCLDAPQPYLPRWLRRRGITRAQMQKVVTRSNPWLRRVETLLMPRWSGLVTGAGERILGVVALLLSVTLLLPIPFANFLPGAALVAFALALVTRDGLLSLLGYALTAATAWFLPALFVAGMEIWTRYMPGF